MTNARRWAVVVLICLVAPLGSALGAEGMWMPMQIPELAERGRGRLEAFMEVLDGRLSNSRHVALDRFTMADIGAYVCVDFAGWVKLPVLGQWPNIRRWCGESGVSRYRGAWRHARCHGPWCFCDPNALPRGSARERAIRRTV